jgi:hypothetical protein
MWGRAGASYRGGVVLPPLSRQRRHAIRPQIEEGASSARPVGGGAPACRGGVVLLPLRRQRRPAIPPGKSWWARLSAAALLPAAKAASNNRLQLTPLRGL